MTTLSERAKQAIDVFGSQQRAADAIKAQCGLRITQAAISKVASGKHGDDPGLSIVPILLAVVARFNVLWMTRGIGPRDLPSQLPLAVPASTLQTSSIVQTAEGPMEMTSDAIYVARAFMALPENKRDDFKRWIETVALEYRTPVPDHQLEHLRAPGEPSDSGKVAVTVAAPRPKRR